jgi:hypothetical protein
MIVRKAKFKVSGMMLFNAGVALFLLATAGIAARSMLVKEPPAQCSARYSQALLYPWSRADGQAFAAADLQAKLGGFDWGVIDNVRFIEGAPVVSKVAIEVGLPKDAPRAAGDRTPVTRRSGMGFTWQPVRIKDATSACLGYGVWVPADMDASNGLTLPGLFGMADTEPLGDRAPVFSTRMRWREDQRIEVVAVTPDSPGGYSLQVDPNYTKLQRGRWMRIEQEVALNTPGRKDGLLRVWVDGEFKLERTDLAYRQDPAQGIRGVDASVYYSRPNHAWMPSPKDGAVRLSPFEIRWR